LRGRFQQSAGKAYCEEVRTNNLLHSPSNDGTSSEFEQHECPTIGMTCEDGKKTYTGYYWHDTSIELPVKGETKMYTCINLGECSSLLSYLHQSR
jgi:hypothetical protein